MQTSSFLGRLGKPRSYRVAPPWGIGPWSDIWLSLSSMPCAPDLDVERGFLRAPCRVQARVKPELARDEVPEARAARGDRLGLIPRLPPAEGLAHAHEAH